MLRCPWWCTRLWPALGWRCCAFGALLTCSQRQTSQVGRPRGIGAAHARFSSDMSSLSDVDKVLQHACDGHDHYDELASWVKSKLLGRECGR